MLALRPVCRSTGHIEVDVGIRRPAECRLLRGRDEPDNHRADFPCRSSAMRRATPVLCFIVGLRSELAVYCCSRHLSETSTWTAGIYTGSPCTCLTQCVVWFSLASVAAGPASFCEHLIKTRQRQSLNAATIGEIRTVYTCVIG